MCAAFRRLMEFSVIINWRECAGQSKLGVPKPPLALAAGGLNDQAISLCRKYSSIICLFHFSSDIRNTFSAPAKLVPLSLYTCSGYPRRPINLRKQLMKQSVDKSFATSKCTALVDRQMNKQPSLFTSVLPCSIRNGPK